MEYVTEVKKRCVSLLTPLLIWGSLWWLCYCRCRGNWLSAVGICTGLPDYEPLWYLRTLFMLVVISPLLLSMSKSKLWLVFLFVCSVSYSLFSGRGELYQFLRYFVSPSGVFWFSCGLMMSRKEGVIYWLTGRISIGFLAISVLILSVKIFLPAMWKFSINQLATPFILLGFAGLMPKREIPAILSKTPILIYLSHDFFVYLCSKMSVRMGLSNEVWWYYLSTSALVIVVSIAFSCFVRERFPSLAKYLCGGR